MTIAGSARSNTIRIPERPLRICVTPVTSPRAATSRPGVAPVTSTAIWRGPVSTRLAASPTASSNRITIRPSLIATLCTVAAQAGTLASQPAMRAMTVNTPRPCRADVPPVQRKSMLHPLIDTSDRCTDR
ncbi:hypothetical protein QP162_03620 [Sphingomonas aurantiaca]|uniref:hypothetical protein n=1 Tax=Sphingomonas aurantiaca TaxID=185949 RepID=UPI002FE1EA20